MNILGADKKTIIMNAIGLIMAAIAVLAIVVFVRDYLKLRNTVIATVSDVQVLGVYVNKNIESGRFPRADAPPPETPATPSK